MPWPGRQVEQSTLQQASQRNLEKLQSCQDATVELQKWRGKKNGLKLYLWQMPLLSLVVFVCLDCSLRCDGCLIVGLIFLRVWCCGFHELIVGSIALDLDISQRQCDYSVSTLLFPVPKMILLTALTCSVRVGQVRCLFPVLVFGLYKGVKEVLSTWKYQYLRMIWLIFLS